ncbi:uncharacterized protein L201_007183 [Kwoniella dendrophila CBS 6074]|uniref:Rho GTPase activator n=1 Tax=Kwoniella dendrophila CBS 6074 TaxID=1295534 RepID=A0AAX4K513_9TREE
MSSTIQSTSPTLVNFSQGQIQAPITLSNPITSSTSTSSAIPSSLNNDNNSTPARTNTLPPSYASLPESSKKSSSIINTQEEKQALRNARQQLQDEVDYNRGHLSPGRTGPMSLNPSKSEGSGSSSGATANSNISNSNGPSTEINDTFSTQIGAQAQTDNANDVFNDNRENGDSLEIGHRGYLPQGLDVRDALAKCEDPTLGWSLQFWVTIADPLTQHVFFACPASGQCSWDPPVGAFVVPRSPDGEWWELADATRGNRSYYYNTLTGKTQWTRPGGNAFVIPLGLIQQSALPTRPSPQSPSSRIIPTTPSRSNRQIRQLDNPTSPNSLQTPSANSSYPRPPNSPLNSIPRPIHSPSKSTRSVSISPSSSYGYGNSNGPSQTLEAIVLNHFASPSSYTANGDNQNLLTGGINTNTNIIQTSPSKPPSGFPQIQPQTQTQTHPSNLPTIASTSQLSIVEEGGITSGNEADMSDYSAPDPAGGGWWEKRKSQVLTVKTGFKSPNRKFKGLSFSDGNSPIDALNSSLAKGSPLKKSRHQITAPILERNESTAESLVSETPTELTVLNGINGTNGSTTPGIPRNMPAEPIYVEHNGSVKTKRMSTGLHPLLPTAISGEILAFQTDDFARKYFATKRSGIMRQKVPVERIINWSKQSINSSLLNLSSKNLIKDSIITFKVIQHVMGERKLPVENAKPFPQSSTSTSSSYLNLSSLVLNGRKDDKGHPDRNGKLANGFTALNNNNISGSNEQSNNNSGDEYDEMNMNINGKSEKMQVLEEIRWMIQLCVSSSEMRDEVYCQLIKQLTKNPNHDSVVLGFQLFCVQVNAFGPSKNFEPFVKNFLSSNSDEKADGIGIMSKYCIGKLDSLIAKGGRGKALTVGEIEHASDAAFYPSVYGESLDRIMELQKRAYPTLKVPVILPFLADGILALGGLQAEGIFRVPGDGDSVNELKSRMDRGHYQLKGIDDPHVASSLFKLWLRELEEPIIPNSLYNEALLASKSSEESIDFLLRLPIYNRRVLLFVISFTQLFMKDDVIKQTKMTPGNLALVMAPNILRTTSNSLVTVFTNSSFESKFILQLLENLDPATIDEDYVPTHAQPIGRV